MSELADASSDTAREEEGALAAWRAEYKQIRRAEKATRKDQKRREKREKKEKKRKRCREAIITYDLIDCVVGRDMLRKELRKEMDEDAKQSNATRRKLIHTVDASLAHAGADDETRRPVMYLLDKAVEKHLRDVSKAED